ncbi:MAG: hypothetical protein ACRC67_30165 [Inquilinus sp.]|uniref:hypothetical protein n=1 Tax=Inquilinus sp. TaxID=1932117 RepID=UPI003F36EA54
MQALTARDQEFWDKAIDRTASEADKRSLSDSIDTHLATYRAAKCKLQAGADLGNCIAKEIQDGLSSKEENHSVHARCFAAFQSGY